MGHRRIVIEGDTLTIDPASGPSDSTRFEVEGSHDGSAFLTMGTTRRPLPLSDDDIARLATGLSLRGAVSTSGESNIVDYSGLPPGKYAFVLMPLFDPLDFEDENFVPIPLDIAILTVEP